MDCTSSFHVFLQDSGPVHQDGEEKPGTSASSASLEIVMQGAASLSKGKR